MGNAPSTAGGLPAGHPDSVTSSSSYSIDPTRRDHLHHPHSPHNHLGHQRHGSSPEAYRRGGPFPHDSTSSTLPPTNTIPIATSSNYTGGVGPGGSLRDANSHRPRFPFVKEQYITDSPAASSPIDSEYASSVAGGGGGGLGIGGADSLPEDNSSTFRQQPRIGIHNSSSRGGYLPGGGTRRRASSLSTTGIYATSPQLLNEQALVASAAHQDRIEQARLHQHGGGSSGTDSRASYRNSARVSRAFGDHLEPLKSTVDDAMGDGLRDGMVPTIITWSQGGNNVYVTGTFNNWKQKVRLNKSTNDFSTILNLPPGTHRIKFIVDDEWKCSTELSAATDAEGNLVNFLEVADEEQDELDGGQYTPINGSPVGSYTDQIPSYAQSLASSGHPSPSGSENQVTPLTSRSSELPPALAPSTPTTTTTDANDVSDSPSSVTSAVSSSKAFPASPVPSQSPPPPAPFTTDPPPGLPPHLEKVILNNTPSKEDNSVLPVPNHVVLNHLYACSVKEGVLSISVTSRYRKKYITTVYIKPVVV